MKIILSSFLDFNQATIDQQILLAQTLNLKEIPIRYVEGKRLTLLSEEKISYVTQALQKAKIKILLFDPLLASYPIFDAQAHQNYIKELNVALDMAKKLKTSQMYYEIPLFGDITSDTPTILNHVMSHIAIFKKYRMIPVIKPNHHHKSNTYRFLLNAIKEQLFIAFNSEYLYENNEPLTTSYRLLKDHIKVVIASDMDHLKQPRLLGYGNLEMMTLFKRLFKNDYEGYVVYDTNLPTLISSAQKKRGLFANFSKKKKVEDKLYQDLLQRVGSDQIEDILYHQMTILNVILFNKKISVG